MLNNPFKTETTLPLVAIKGMRGGYIQLSPSSPVEHYNAMPLSCLEAALAWATVLESTNGIERCYWITLSEAVKQLHIHLYPRYQSDALPVGIPLFEERNNASQPEWTPELNALLAKWSAQFNVCVLEGL
jgi:diadenosine tetraphosphate (Ap4A) HIT family hydrolase